MKKVLYTRGRKFLVKDVEKDYHTQFGLYKKEDIKKSGKVISNTGKEGHIIDASFTDIYRKIKRGAQIIPLKDVGFIVSETGINKESIVVDAGAGSGGLSCFLAHLVKKVTTYEVREDFKEIVEHNKDFLELKNLTIKLKDIYEGIDEKNVDLVTLDVPEPWNAIDSASKALKPGGFLISYSPCIPQVSDFVEKIVDREDFMYIKTSEIIEREWDVEKRKIRPKSVSIGHSGFLTVVRKL